MGRLTSSGRRRFLRVLAVSALAIGALATWALAAGPGGWDHLGDRGTPGTDSLDARRRRAGGDAGRELYVGGEFTDAGGIANADRIAKWNGSSWSARQLVDVADLERRRRRHRRRRRQGLRRRHVHERGDEPTPTTSRSGTARAGSRSAPCPDRRSIGNVRALQVVGPTLYVGGDFQDGAGIATADYLLACNLATGAPSATTVDPAHPFSGPVKALTATSNGTLYAGGRFTNLENIPAADNVAYLPAGGTWHAMGAGGGPCGCALDAFVRGLTADGTDVYVGTDGIERRRHRPGRPRREVERVGVERPGLEHRRHGRVVPGRDQRSTAWPAVGSNVFATGSFQNANGDARADNVAWFDGTDVAPGRVQRRRQRAVGRRRAPPSRSSTGSSMRPGASPAPAATPRRSPPPRSRSRRSSPTRRPR